MERKYTRREVLVAGAAAAALPALAGAQALEKKKVTIAVGGKNLLYYLPLTVAEQKGFFKDEGLDVEIVGRHSAPGDALAAGRVLLALLPLLERGGVRTVNELIWLQRQARRPLIGR